MSLVNRSKYRSRIIDSQIDEYLTLFPAICVEGPRWCGKSWSSSFHSKSEVSLSQSISGQKIYDYALLDSKFVLDGQAPHLIDEWQIIPSLWDDVKNYVDTIGEGEKGQFILTGSSTPKQKGFFHSGTGRFGIIKMRPMSLFESNDSSGNISLLDVCLNKPITSKVENIQLDKLAKTIIRGGWPASIDVPIEKGNILAKSYLDLTFSGKKFNIDNRMYNTTKMKNIFRSLSRNESTVATDKKILSDLGEDINDQYSKITLSEYLDLFRRLFLIDDIPSFSSNLVSPTYTKKAYKRHLVDPSLACASLNINIEKLMNDLFTFGFMFESLCLRDLLIYSQSFNASLYHYQDYDNDEIDAIIQLEDGCWCGVEIKLGMNQVEKASQNLIRIKNKLNNRGESSPTALIVICGMAAYGYKREDGVYVIPITQLKN